jgi:predicted nucleic acid-binding protein
MPPIFVDTNILLRYLTRDDEQKAQRALNLLVKVEQGEEKVVTSSLVFFETIFTLQHSYKVSRQQIRELILPIIALRGLQLPSKNVYYQAFDFYITKNISFADAYNAAYMLSEGISNIYSWDKDFDRIEGIVRLEPGGNQKDVYH